MTELDKLLNDLLGLEIINLKQYLGLQRALRIAAEAELIMDRVESINNNGE